jgi:hypothetical protein
MTRKLISLAVAAALAGGAVLAPAPAFAQNAEIEALKQQLAALSAKLDELEKSQAQQKKAVDETQATADKTADVVAQEKSRFSFAGDLRYRNESFDVQYVDRNRDRDRIRARLNATFRVNDTITGQIGFSTGADDPRSGNQTLDGQNSRKPFALDVAYVTWAPNAQWKVTAGKQRYPWTRSPSLFFDNDVSPEGLAVNYTQGNFFAGAFYDWLAERGLSNSNVTTGTNTDSLMFGGQVGYRIPFSDSVRMTVAGTYFDFDGVQGYNPLFGGASFGNTTVNATATNSPCARAVAAGAACLLSDYDIVEVFADLTATVGGLPLRFFADYAQNLEAEVNPVAQEELDTAYSAGISYGAASAAKGTWEVGLIYQQIEKDALFGQLLDSDFGDGNTDTKGFVLRGGYTVARNWTVNATLFLNDLGNDVPQTVTVFNETTPAPFDTTAIAGVFDRDYKRLQLDLNFRF